MPGPPVIHAEFLQDLSYYFVVREGTMATINHSGASPPRLAGARIGRIAARAHFLRTHTARGQGLVEYALILVLMQLL